MKEWSAIKPSLKPKIEFPQIARYFDSKFVDERQNLYFMGVPETGIIYQSKVHDFYLMYLQADMKEDLSQSQQTFHLINGYRYLQHIELTVTLVDRFTDHASNDLANRIA